MYLDNATNIIVERKLPVHDRRHHLLPAAARPCPAIQMANETLQR